jgi:hypothetical protein
MAWRWRYERAGGAEVGQDFPTQGEAEAFLGEVWADLLADGVPAVTLLEDDREVYGPMSLSPAE